MKQKDVKLLMSRRDFFLLSSSTILTEAMMPSAGSNVNAFTIGKPLSVGEGLMQEHGVLGRLILIYDELSIVLLVVLTGRAMLTF